MKRRALLCCAILLLTFFLAHCSNKKTSENSGTIDSVQASSTPSVASPPVDTPNPEPKTKTLSIKGNEIWVRNTPTKGEVVMKLNDGDQCKILKTGYYEVIRGEGNFWYSIEFNGKQGWVFGSQTNAETDLTTLSAATTDVLWTKFVDFSKKSIEEYNAAWKTKDEQENIALGTTEVGEKVRDQPGQLVYTNWHEGGNQSGYYFSMGKVTDNFSILAYRQSMEGAVGFVISNNFIPVFKGKDGYKLQMNIIPYPISFDGTPDTIITVEPGKKILLAKAQVTGGAMVAEVYYNVYLIDEASGTLQRAQTQLGYSDFGGGMTMQAAEGDIFVVDLSVAYSSKGQLRLIQKRQIKKGEGLEALEPPGIELYQWDKAQKEFRKK